MAQAPSTALLAAPLLMKMRVLLPSWPAALKLSVAPAVRLRLARVNSEEFTPVPPAVEVIVLAPWAMDTAPTVSVEFV